MTINNNNIFGAFTLNEARGSRLTGDWLNKEFVANYGWFGGGVGPLSTVNRIDFSNDSITAQSRGPLSSSSNSHAAAGNSNYGWFGGGYSPTLGTKVNRIDFSNDSSVASVRGPLTLARKDLEATGNSNYGWFGGGIIPTPATFSTVDRIDFSNDSSTASPRGPLSSIRNGHAAVGNSNYGWFGGGFTTVPVATVNRIDFSNDFSTASPRGPLSVARYELAATGNSNYGWFGGGSVFSADFSRVDRIDFSNDSTSALVRGPLSASLYALKATGNSNYGWFGGGFFGPSLTSTATVDRIDFSNDSSTASQRGSLNAPPVGRFRLAATSGVLNIRRQKAGNFGWFGGGDTPTPAVVATVDRIDFSNDTGTASVRGSLSLARFTFAATGNSNYGWFGGGSVSSPAVAGSQRSTVDRIDFSNDSGTASPRGPLSLARYSFAATANSNYGWFVAGASLPAGTQYNTVDRIDFSNDFSTASPRGSLLTTRQGLAATGNSNYGWFGGGGTPVVSTVDRIDFSNDLATVSPRGSLNAPTGRQGSAATGNSNYGWFGGGAGPGIIAVVDRIDFSNDSVTSTPRGPLSTARSSLAATGNSNYGWFGGGTTVAAPVARVSTVDRIDFSNDSASASIRGSLTPATGKSLYAATSNTSR